MKKLKRILACLSLLALTTAFVSCGDNNKVTIKDIEITEAVDSKYVQPNELDFIYNKTNDGEYLDIKRIKSTKEEINIASQYGGYEVRNFQPDYYVVDGEPFINTTTKKIILPDTIEKINGSILFTYSNLEEIVLPKKLNKIIHFLTSPSLKKIEISSDNEYFKVENNKLIDKENNRLLKVFNLENDSITIDGFKEIGDNAICKTDLTEIIFSDGVEEISGTSIRGNQKLTSITLPSTFKGFVPSYDNSWETALYSNYAIFSTNENLKTIYNYSNVELDLSSRGIEVINMTK